MIGEGGEFVAVGKVVVDVELDGVEKFVEFGPVVHDNAFAAGSACSVHVEHEPYLVKFIFVGFDIFFCADEANFFGSKSDETDAAGDAVFGIG